MNGSRAGSRRLHPVPRPDQGGPDASLATPLLTVNELCRLLGMSPRWVHERTRRQEIPCYRFGTALRFDLDEIRRWMANFHAVHSNGNGVKTWGS